VITIYYSDATTYQGPPERAPERDVQVIVQHDADHGWHLTLGSDYYVWRTGAWVGVDLFGLWDYLAAPGWKRVLFGRTIGNEEFQAIYRKAKGERNQLNREGIAP